MTWEKRKFAEIVSKLQNGGTPSTKIPELWDGNIPWITGADFAKQKLAVIRRYISPRAVQTSSTNVVIKGNLLLVTRTGVGKMAIAPFNVAISQDITGVYFDSEISSEFMLYKFQHEIGYFLRLNQGTSINGITRNDLLDFETEIPTSKIEQKRIAEILSTADEAIEQTQALIDKYNRIKRGLMQDLLTRGIDENGNIRSKQTHKFTVKNGIEVPDDWEVAKLSELGNSKDYLKTGPFGSSLKISDWVETGVPVVTIGSIGENSIDETQLLFVSKEKAEFLTPHKLQTGDILFSRVADVGRSIVINNEQNGWIMSSNFMRLRIDKKKMLPSYLQINLKANERVKAQIRKYANSGGRDVVNSEVLNSLYFPKPNPSEQIEILRSCLKTQKGCNLRSIIRIIAI